MKYRFHPTLILFFTLFSVLIQRFSTYIFIIFIAEGFLSGDVSTIDATGILSIPLLLLGVIIPLLILIAFIDSFRLKRLSRKYYLYGALNIIAFVGLMTVAVPLSLLLGENSLSEFAVNFNPDDTIPTNVLDALRSLTDFWSIYILLSVAVSLIIIIDLIRTIIIRYKDSNNKGEKNLLKVILIASIFILLSTIIYVPFLTDAFNTLSYMVIAIIYLKYGPDVFQSQSVNQLILVNFQTGTPIHGYTFGDPREPSLSDSMAKEILFSGALTAISSVISEFTKLNDKITEITIGQGKIIIESIETPMVAVLYVDKETIAIRAGLQSFVKLYKNLFDELPSHEINNEQIKIINNLIERIFGRGKS